MSSTIVFYGAALATALFLVSPSTSPAPGETVPEVEVPNTHCAASVLWDEGTCGPDDEPDYIFEYSDSSHSSICPPFNGCESTATFEIEAQPNQRVDENVGNPCPNRSIEVTVTITGCNNMSAKKDIVVKEKFDCDLICIATVRAVCGACQ